jgi:hypothetical protein
MSVGDSLRLNLYPRFALDVLLNGMESWHGCEMHPTEPVPSLFIANCLYINMALSHGLSSANPNSEASERPSPLIDIIILILWTEC